MSVTVHDRGPTWSFPLSMMHASCVACDEWHSHNSAPVILTDVDAFVLPG